MINKRDITAFAYYWPGFHPSFDLNPMVTNPNSEWELVRNAKGFFPGHYQPRIPLWGYLDESSPDAMGLKIRAATDYGIDSLLFSLCWYEGRPYFDRPFKVALDLCQDTLGCRPAIMWANHDRYYAFPEDGGATPRKYLVQEYEWRDLERMIAYWVNEYMQHPGYYRTKEERPFFCIYSPNAMIRKLGSPDLLKRLIEHLRGYVQKAGLPPIHIHACEIRFLRDVSVLGVFDSCSDYLSLGYSENAMGKESTVPYVSYWGELIPKMDTDERLQKIAQSYEYMQQIVPIEYWPVVTVGRDCSPRVDRLHVKRIGHYSSRPIVIEFAPDIFAKACENALRYMNKNHGGKGFVFLNAWNEWTEGSYLEPDTVYEYKFLEAFMHVFRAGAVGEETHRLA